MLSNLPLQVVLYFNGWYDAFYVILMLGLYIWKGTALPYPGPLSGLLGLEIVLLFLLAAIEYARISLASRGNKTERSPSLILSVLLAFPSTYLFFYFFYQQVYVTRLDLIVSVTGIGFVALETLISLLVIMTLSTRHAPVHPTAAAQTHAFYSILAHTRPRLLAVLTNRAALACAIRSTGAAGDKLKSGAVAVRRICGVRGVCERAEYRAVLDVAAICFPMERGV